MIREMTEAVQQAQSAQQQPAEEQVPMAKAGYVKMRMKEMREGGMADELETNPTINDTPDGRKALVSGFNQG